MWGRATFAMEVSSTSMKGRQGNGERDQPRIVLWVPALHGEWWTCLGGRLSLRSYCRCEPMPCPGTQLELFFSIVRSFSREAIRATEDQIDIGQPESARVNANKACARISAAVVNRWVEGPF